MENKKLQVVVRPKLDTNGFAGKVYSYNLGEQFNYAVIALNISIAESTHKNLVEPLEIRCVPQVRFIAPFVTQELASQYLKELSDDADLLVLMVPIKDGRAICDWTVDSGIVEYVLQNKKIK